MTYQYRIQGYPGIHGVVADSKWQALRIIGWIFTVDGQLPEGVVQFV